MANPIRIDLGTPPIWTIVRGEDRRLQLILRQGEADLPVDLGQASGIEVHLLARDMGIIKRRTAGFEVQPRQVMPGASSTDIIYPGHGLVTGDTLRFSGNAPFPLVPMAQTAVVQGPDTFRLADGTGEELLFLRPETPFVITQPDDLVVGDPGLGILQLRLRSPVTEALQDGPAQAFEVHIQQPDQLRIVQVIDRLDVLASLDDRR